MQWVQRLVGRFTRLSSQRWHYTAHRYRASATLLATAGCLYSNAVIATSAESNSSAAAALVRFDKDQSDATAKARRFLEDAVLESSSGPRVWSGQVMQMLYNVPDLIGLLKDPKPQNQLLGARALCTVLRYCVSSRPDLIKVAAAGTEASNALDRPDKNEASNRTVLRSFVHKSLSNWIQLGLFTSLLELCQSSNIELRFNALEIVELLMGAEEIFAIDHLQRHMQQPAEAALGVQVFRAVLLDQTSMHSCEVNAGPEPAQTPLEWSAISFREENNAFSCAISILDRFLWAPRVSLPQHEESNDLRVTRTAKVLAEFMDDAVLKACTNAFVLAGWEPGRWRPFVSSEVKDHASRTATLILAFLNDLFQTVDEYDKKTTHDKTASALVHRIVSSGLLAAALNMIPDEDVDMEDKIRSVHLLHNCCWEANSIAPRARDAVFAQAKASCAEDLLSDLLMKICVDDVNELSRTMEFVMVLATIDVVFTWRRFLEHETLRAKVCALDSTLFWIAFERYIKRASQEDEEFEDAIITILGNKR